MKTPTGELFKCQCCNGSYDESEAFQDAQLGIICDECDTNAKFATIFLAKVGISRPIAAMDINVSNHKRFKL